MSKSLMTTSSITARCRSIVCRRRHRIQALHLQRILASARAIAAKNPAALREYVALLGRPLQSRRMLRPVLPTDGIDAMDPQHLWFQESSWLQHESRSLRRVLRRVSTPVTMDLSRDLVLPWPWEVSRVQECLATIGQDTRGGAWRQDSNHVVEVWLPFRIGWVHNGNHSIATGILQGRGEFTTTEAFAAIFEVGRLMRR